MLSGDVPPNQTVYFRNLNEKVKKEAATNAFRGLQDFDFYGKKMGHQPSRFAKPPQEPAAPPNNILFLQNMPDQTTSMMLQILFQQYPGFREVRMIEAKPGIAFVEYEDENQSMVAMEALQGFKISPENPMAISYAKR
ncbi:hypothetical protein ACQJBY_033005 [Aegilops geniculata]